MNIVQLQLLNAESLTTWTTDIFIQNSMESSSVHVYVCC